MQVIQETRSSKDTVRDLLRIWRSYTGEDTTLYLSDEMKGFNDLLLRFFAKYFGGDLIEWERFVVFVSASGYLMGRMSGFHASLGWLLDAEIIFKIKQGWYHTSCEKKRFKESKESLDAFLVREMEESSRSTSLKINDLLI